MEEASSSAPNIPGFYCDPISGRYFRTPPNGVNDSVFKSFAAKRGLLGNKSKMKEPSKVVATIPMSRLIAQRETGLLPSGQLQNKLRRNRISSVACEAAVIECLEQFFSVPIQCDSFDGTSLFGLWRTPSHDVILSFKVSRYQGTRRMCREESAPAHWPAHAVVDMRSVRVGDVAAHLSVTPSTFRSKLSSHVTLHAYIPCQSGGSVWFDWFFTDEVWSCAYDEVNKVIAGGTSGGHIKTVNIVSEREMTREKREKTPVIALDFSEDGHLLFCGHRSVSMCCVDVRGAARNQLSYSSASSGSHWLRVSGRDPNHVYSATYNGQLLLWDVRRVDRPCISYVGHQNTHSKLSCCLDSRENLIFAAGEDSVVRCWSVTDGSAVCASFACPSSSEEERELPQVVYSDTWTGRPGDAALLIIHKHLLHWRTFPL